MSNPALLHLARRNLVIGLVATAAVTALDACQDSPAPLDPTASSDVRAAKTGPGKPGSGETVLFTGTVNGNSDIYAMNPDGSNVRRLTTDTLIDSDPDFSPDNRKLVFIRTAGSGMGKLYTANVDGSKQTPLTSSDDIVLEPRWSPDGTKIAFVSFSVEGQHDIYTINADGTGLHRLTYEASDERFPSWSPDGTKIAFESGRSGTRQVYVMGADGLNVQPVTVNCGGIGCGEPAFSPDGTEIAVASFDYGNIQVFATSGDIRAWIGPSLYVDGTNADRSSHHPTWSKDGKQLFFASDRGIENTDELYVGSRSGGTNQTIRRLTVFSPGTANNPAYSH